MSVTLKSVKNYSPICTAILTFCMASFAFNVYFMYLIQQADKPSVLHYNTAPIEYDLQPEIFHTGYSNSKFHVDTDGVSCDDPNCYYQMDARELARDYQIEVQDNGDAILYDGREYKGVIPYFGHEKCTLQRLIMADND